MGLASTWLPSIERWVSNRDAIHPRKRCQLVRRSPRLADDFLDRDTMGDQRIGDQRAMTAPRDGFGTHQRDALAFGQFDDLGEMLVECRCLHVVGVAAKRWIAPRRIGR